MGAGLADPEAVFRVIVVVPFVRVVVVDVTDSLEGLGVVPVPEIVLAADCLRCGMREGVCSSGKWREKLIPMQHCFLINRKKTYQCYLGIVSNHGVMGAWTLVYSGAESLA